MKTDVTLRDNITTLMGSLLAMAFVAMLLVFAVVQFTSSRANLADNAKLVAQVVLEDSRGPLLFSDQRILATKFSSLDVYPAVNSACLFDANGMLVARYHKADASQCPNDPAADGEAFLGDDYRLTQGVFWRDTRIGTLELGADQRTVITNLISFVVPMVLFGLAVFVAVFFAGRRMAHRAIQPLKAMTRAANAIGGGDLTVRIDDDGPREVREVALTMNAVIDDLIAARQSAEDELAERRRAQSALSDAERQLRSIIDLVPYLIFAVREDGSVVFANRAVAEAYGTTQTAITDGSFFAANAGKTDELLLVDAAQANPDGEIWFTNEDEDVRRFVVTRVPFEDQDQENHAESLVIAVDVTEERRLQIQLQFSQRLEVVGTLAGGIAHDFNNLLTPIMGYTSLLLDNPADDASANKLEAIYSAALKARDLIQQILTFSRHQHEATEQRRIDPSEVLDEAVNLLRASIPSSIDIDVVRDDVLPPIMANPGQLHQVIVNLCTNAAQAIETPRGKITLALSWSKPGDAQRPAVLASADCVRLTVSDSGKGMSNEVRSRVFEPFFTTKNVGEGSGLGLSVVHGIVSAHGGAITVASNPGNGSTFSVFLPAADRPSAVATAPIAAGVGSNARIMLVDDESAVLRATKDLLDNMGYRVRAFSQGETAIAELRANPDDVDILVTDNLMPGLTGVELATAVRIERPDLPVLLVTGYLDEKAEQHPAITATLMKPASGRELAAAIQRVLVEETVVASTVGAIS